MSDVIKIKKKALKALQDRVLRDKNGKRYVLLSDKKRIKVKDDISERQLLVWLIKHLKPRRKKLKIPKEPTQNKPPNVYPGGVDRSTWSQSIINFDALERLKHELKEKERSLKEREALPPAASPPALPPATPAPTRPTLPPAPVPAITAATPKPSTPARSAKREDNVWETPKKSGKDEATANTRYPGSSPSGPKVQEVQDVTVGDKTFKDIPVALVEHAAKETQAKEQAQNEAKRIRTEKRIAIYEKKIAKFETEINGLGDAAYDTLYKVSNLNALKTRVKNYDLDQPQSATKDELIKILENHGKIKSRSQLRADAWTEDKRERLEKLQTELAREHNELEQIGKGTSHDKGLTELELDAIMKKYPEYLGTIAADEVGTLDIPKKGRFGFIMNTDKRSQKGTHWVACYGDARPDGSNSLEYYNSFAEPPTKDFMKEMKNVASKMDAGTYLKFKENKIIDQSATSANCGYFAAKFLIDRFRGKPFSECSGYDDHVKQEKDIESFKKRLNIEPFKYVDGFGGEGFLGDLAKNIGDRIKGFFTGRVKPPPAIRALLASVGNESIVSLKVGRSPVNSVITGILNAVSSGQLEQNRKDLAYDQIYHLVLVVQTTSRTFTLERNQTVSVGPARQFDEMRDVRVPDEKFGTFLEKGERISKQPFWQYNPVNNNCQIFVSDLLRGSGLMTSELNSFINQDAEGLLKNSPLAKTFAEKITDFGGRLDILLNGAGLKGAGFKTLPPWDPKSPPFI